MEAKKESDYHQRPDRSSFPLWQKTGWFEQLKENGLVFNSTTEALESLGFDINKNSAKRQGRDNPI